VKGH
jgi:hypothetical protein